MAYVISAQDFKDLFGEIDKTKKFARGILER